MLFLSIREFSKAPSAALSKLAQDEKAVLTNNGKPAAIVIPVNTESFERVYNQIQEAEKSKPAPAHHPYHVLDEKERKEAFERLMNFPRKKLPPDLDDKKELAEWRDERFDSKTYNRKPHMATIIDGRAIAAKVCEEARVRAEEVKRRGVVPCLAVVLVGDDPASVAYVRGKGKALAEAGMEGRDIRLPAAASEGELLALVAALNADEKVHGILVQLPLPPHIREEAVIEAIDPAKDVDCFHPVSLGRLLRGQAGFVPCTPAGIVALLESQKIPIAGSHAVVVGRSNIVGKPLAMLLAGRSLNATVTICHTGTKDLAAYTRQADILVAAAGKPGLITGEMIKEGAAVIDVGVNPAPEEPRGEEFYHEPHEQKKKTTEVHGEKNTEEHGGRGKTEEFYHEPHEQEKKTTELHGGRGKTEEIYHEPHEQKKKKGARRLVGDVVFDEAAAKAAWITPVPGGVGPMTIAMLMRNVVLAAEIGG